MSQASSFDGHYRLVLDAMLSGRVTPLLGAGANLCGRPLDVKWPSNGAYLPSGVELARWLAERFAYPPEEPLDLARVAQYTAVVLGRGALYDVLRDLFVEASAQPTPLHAFIASIPRLLRVRGRPRYQLVLTTNYDDLLERAFAAEDEPFDVVWYAADGKERGKFWHRPPSGDAVLIEEPNAYAGLSLEERTVILKLHGSIDYEDRERDSFVITEDHYADYLTRADIESLVPVKLSERMAWSHFLLLGHSMRDWNLRVILYRIWGGQKLNFRSWSIQLAPSELERTFWEKRGDVDVIDQPLDEYVDGLVERLAEIGRSGVSA